MAFTDAAANAALDAITIDRVQLHSGDPGASGVANALGSKVAATLNAGSSRSRTLASDVVFTGLAANQSVTHISWWLNSGTVFKGGFAITSGATAANSSGEYTLKATTTKLSAT